MARTGRRPGRSDTRESILVAARHAFAERGYDGASIRHIATTAGVDPALVHHYFGTKDALFLAVMRAPVDPAEVLSGLGAGGPEGFGDRLLTALLRVWDSPAGESLAGLVRSAVAHEWSARLLREFLTTQVLRRALAPLELPAHEAPLRAALIASQLIGLVMARYILRLDPLAGASADSVRAAVAPTIQRYLTGPLA